MNLQADILAGAGLFAAGAGLCFLTLRRRETLCFQSRIHEAQTALEEARRTAESITRDARLAANQEALRLRDQIEQSFVERHAARADSERRLGEREALLNTQLARLLQTEQDLNEERQGVRTRSEALRGREKELDALLQASSERLREITGLDPAVARQQFLQNVELQSLQSANQLTRHILEDARSRAEEKARQILSVAIQRYASDHTSTITTSTLALPNDEIKGRIIGREGRNIRTFEAVAGVTVLVDDTPGAVVISGFDPVRREIAREAMSRLIQDGRIHPTRIEEELARVAGEMEETIMRLGNEAIGRVGIPPLHPELAKLLGRLHFRHSYSQNILDHSVEVAHLTGLMAAELGSDVMAAKRAGLLHDVGKAVSHEMEGPHAIVGADLVKRYGESEAVVNGVASHHNEVPPLGPLGLLVSAADAISASRPGARSESMTTFLRRVEDLEAIASSFAGVEKCFAIQAGRELRVFVQPGKLNEEESFALARRIAVKIESDLQYPGQIKITVIRETRCVEIAT